MAITLILPTDTLEAGFRVKANNNFGEEIVGYQLLKDNNGAYTGVIRLIKFSGGFISVDLSNTYYTKAQIGSLLAAINSSPYSGAWDVTKIPYASKSITDNGGRLWRANISTNTEPGTDGTWDNVLADSPTGPTEIDFPAGVSLDLDIDYGSDVNVPGLFIYAQLYTVNNVIDPTGANVFVPYVITDFRNATTNHIIIRRSDPGDH